jgi:hypothetical protein
MPGPEREGDTPSDPLFRQQQASRPGQSRAPRHTGEGEGGANQASGEPQSEESGGVPARDPSAQKKIDELRREHERLLNTPLGKMLSQMDPPERSKGIFDCAMPKIVLSPYDIQRIYGYEITKEKAIEEGQPWVERLKTFDRQELERRIKAIETYKRESFPKVREKFRTQQQAELLDYEIEAIREELRQRERE